jgi:hypothetical protein
MNWIWTLLWLVVAVVVGAVARPFWADYSFQILTIVVFLNAMATIGLWQTAARRPEKLKKKFLKRVWNSKPITPKHQPPPPLKKGYAVGDAELQFFSDFEDFANVINGSLADPNIYHHGNPWRLQELPNAELSLWASGGGPAYGRTYAVFHNQARVGEIEVVNPFSNGPRADAYGLRDARPPCQAILRTRSSVAILATMTAAPITSAGRFSPRGPRGIIPSPL